MFAKGTYPKQVRTWVSASSGSHVNLAGGAWQTCNTVVVANPYGLPKLLNLQGSGPNSAWIGIGYISISTFFRGQFRIRRDTTVIYQTEIREYQLDPGEVFLIPASSISYLDVTPGTSSSITYTLQTSSVTGNEDVRVQDAYLRVAEFNAIIT